MLSTLRHGESVVSGHVVFDDQITLVMMKSGDDSKWAGCRRRVGS